MRMSCEKHELLGLESRDQRWAGVFFCTGYTDGASESH